MLVVHQGGKLGPPDPLELVLPGAMGGDPSALRELVALLLPRARNLVRYLIRGDQDVDDVAQEALIDVLRGLEGYRGDGRFQSWVDRVVARATFAWLRRNRRNQEPLDEQLTDERRPAPDQLAERRQLVRRLDTLPAEQRHALVLHHVVGLTVPEIASETGAPAETVRSRLRRGMQRLRSELVEEVPDAAAG